MARMSRCLGVMRQSRDFVSEEASAAGSDVVAIAGAGTSVGNAFPGVFSVVVSAADVVGWDG